MVASLCSVKPVSTKMSFRLCTTRIRTSSADEFLCFSFIFVSEGESGRGRDTRESEGEDRVKRLHQRALPFGEG
ncbi:hypothetical protein K435DRAFT_783716 [Dendrothele bispora CBS 962.96]|uniref:Uncharacterized protein n=1 Tax=Dendrothele bispora (strain CBS 962.96) TaxID=1314807 RepID=A0A4S8L7F8_DENBC|nr:hypothetical protein K435DRAFT_783716 [Dendrothele bispora CBS 962.96]